MLSVPAEKFGVDAVDVLDGDDEHPLAVRNPLRVDGQREGRGADLGARAVVERLDGEHGRRRASPWRSAGAPRRAWRGRRARARRRPGCASRRRSPRARRTRPTAPAARRRARPRHPGPGGTSDPSQHDIPHFPPGQVEFAPRHRSLHRPPASAGTVSSASSSSRGRADSGTSNSRQPRARPSTSMRTVPSNPFEQPALTPSTGCLLAGAVVQERVLERAVVDGDPGGLAAAGRRRRSASRRAAAAAAVTWSSTPVTVARNRTPTLVPVSVIVSPIAARRRTRRLVVLGLDVRLRRRRAPRRRRSTRARRASGPSRTARPWACAGAAVVAAGSGVLVDADVPESPDPHPASTPSTAIAPMAFRIRSVKTARAPAPRPALSSSLHRPDLLTASWWTA